MNRPPDRLIIFTRLPQAGLAKTRLIPALGAEGAARLQCMLAERLLARAQKLARAMPLNIEVRLTDGTPDEARAWLGEGPLYREQGTGELGARMERALTQALEEGAPRAVLAGTDIPGLDREVLASAFAALEEYDLVLGPAADGGYYLVGLGRPAPGLLAGGYWRKLDTLEWRAAELGLSTALLTKLHDLDTPQDLARWQAHGDI
jgi:uncharacterized protein